MNTDDFEKLAGLIKTKSGIVLTPEKTYLLNSRLTPVARSFGLDTIPELVQALKTHAERQKIEEQIIEAMTTNESLFFRDQTPFDLFKNVMVPHFLETRATTRKVRVWCAAASSGQEPYSLCITIKEMASQLATWKFDILGTDLSEEILEKARAAIYSQFEVQRGMPIQLLIKYFEQRGEMWQVGAMLRSMVEYRRFNLLNSFSGLGRFDLIMCRNVLIYFDRETKADILDRIAAILAPDGFLVLGAAETVVGITDSFEPVAGARGLYRRIAVVAKTTTKPEIRLSA
ncbi:MAG: CheR family methyltransferase [Alphaproteobacteria bacterium]